MAMYWLTGGLVIAYLVLTWFLGSLLPLRGSDVWFLRVGLAIIGLLAAGVFLWFYRKGKAAEASAEGESTAGIADVDLIIHEALTGLRRHLGRGLSFRSLPVIFLLGDPGSSKTNSIIHSALNAELLAGHVFQDKNVLPTRVSNVWYSREAVFVDPAGELLTQPARWKRLIRLMQPGRLAASFGKGQHAPRAAIVCFDCGNFLQSGASESAVSAARKLADRLHEMSQLLGISFPVYVLFTKLDKVSFFPEFARGLTKEEASQVLGATLPARSMIGGGYADKETERLTKTFDELFYSLADRRLDLLAQENKGDNLAGIYEFPRELRKLRSPIVQFLVQLARPSQFRVSPFLRGFYFCGVRPLIVDEVVQTSPQVPTVKEDADGATVILSGDELCAPQAPGPARVAGSKKVPQWVFLNQLFNEIIVKDRVALATSGFSTRVSLVRRIALIATAVIAIVCAIGLTVSYIGNRMLLSQVRDAQAVAFSDIPTGQAPSFPDLERLEETGELLDTLGEYGRNDPPLRLRWGLYIGDSLYSQVCSAYSRGLNQLILGPTRVSMAGVLTQLAGQADSTTENQQEYGKAYDLLRTYLIATNEFSHVKSDKTFASDLYKRWPGPQNPTPQQQDLVSRQLNRYATELSYANAPACFITSPDESAVSGARSYLNRFPPDQRMYKAMLQVAAANNKDFDFRYYADEAAHDDYRVPAQFTKGGWSAMMNAFQTPDRYLSGEAWVLGPGMQAAEDARAYVPKLRERYQQDYINQWVEFLRASRFLGYRGPADVPTKIGEVAGGHSALLLVLCVTAENTGMDNNIKSAFTDASGLVPQADCVGKVSGPMNRPYTDSLFTLSDCLEKMRTAVTPDEKENQRKECEDKYRAADDDLNRLIADNAGTNSTANRAVESLLVQPIKGLEPPPPPPPPGAKELCDSLKRLGEEFPNGAGAFDELQNVFKSGGLLEQHPPPTTSPNPRYLSFFNRAKDIQKALYPDGKTLQLHYRITALGGNGVNEFQLMTATHVLSSFNVAQDFVWSGDPQDRIELNVLKTFRISKTGPLSIFQFVNKFGEDGQLNGTNYNFDVPLKLEFAHQTTNEATLKFSLSAGAATMLFEKGSFATSLACTPKISLQP